jgi:multidrug efflux pump subunit AcrB
MADHADHAEVEYATADGNDYAEHEGTYLKFLHLAFVLAVHIINIVLGLAIGAVNGHWLIAVAVFAIATGAAAHGLLTGTRTSSAIALVLAIIAFGMSATG